MRSKEKVRSEIKAQFEPYRKELGENFDAFVDEISAVRFEYLEKYDALPKQPVGVLDGNAVAQRQLFREEALKWVLIKQKYGI